MRVRIDARDGVDAIAACAGVTQKDADGYYYIEVPNDTESFLRMMAPHGRFEMIPPNAVRKIAGFTLPPCEFWMLDFNNDYD